MKLLLAVTAALLLPVLLVAVIARKVRRLIGEIERHCGPAPGPDPTSPDQSAREPV